MKAPVRLFRSLAAEFAGNERLQWGILVACCLFFIHVIILQSDRLASMRQDYATGIDRLQKAKALLAEQDMTNLLITEHDTLDTLKAMLWRAETEGLAAAKLRGALARLLGDLDIESVRFRSGASEPFPELPGAWRTRIRLDANYRAGLELRIVEALAREGKKLFVDRLDLRHHHEDKASLVLVVSAYFIGQEDARN